jgi:hypothetical protein
MSTARSRLGVKVVKRVDHRRNIVRNGFWVDDSGIRTKLDSRRCSWRWSEHPGILRGALCSHLRGAHRPHPPADAVSAGCGWPVVPFQIVPGLASTSPGAVAGLDLAAARVLFLVDRDDGGRRIERKLRRAGVSAERIFMLRSGSATRVTVEDFIEPGLHKAVLDQQLDECGDSQRVPLTVLRALGRSRRLDEWFAKPSPALRPANEAAVAHARVSRARVGEHLLDQARRNALRTVASSMTCPYVLRARRQPTDPCRGRDPGRPQRFVCRRVSQEEQPA